jgi:hypothetical protein
MKSTKIANIAKTIGMIEKIKAKIDFTRPHLAFLALKNPTILKMKLIPPNGKMIEKNDITNAVFAAPFLVLSFLTSVSGKLTSL